MKNRISGVLWGLAFIVAGVGFAGNAFDLWDFELFFDGWWTLFILVPCAASLFSNGPRTGNVIGLAVGGLLLLSAQDILDGRLIGKLIVPVLLVLVGLQILFGRFFGERARQKARQQYAQTYGTAPAGGYADYTAVLGSREERFTGWFDGATLCAVLGGVTLNLRDAVIDHDVVISVSSVFGGVEILVPPNVRVKSSATPIFGGLDNKANDPGVSTAPTVYVNAVCVFGGVDVK